MGKSVVFDGAPDRRCYIEDVAYGLGSFSLDEELQANVKRLKSTPRCRAAALIWINKPIGFMLPIAKYEPATNGGPIADHLSHIGGFHDARLTLLSSFCGEQQLLVTAAALAHTVLGTPVHPSPPSF